jgi:DNA-binding MarR family transcriptional regulator
MSRTTIPPAQSQPTSVRHRVSFDHTIGHPEAVAAANRLNALKVLARFKQARALDIAAALFPDRGFKAALSATQRTLHRLRADKHVTRYLSDSRRVFYALTTKGARILRDAASEGGGDGSAQATAHRASEKTNPEHALWSAFAAISCEARGLRAWTETELKPRFLKKVRGSRSPKRTFPCVYESGKMEKGLMPDALAVSDNDPAFGAVWFEIDRSARGSARLDDLKALVQCLGNVISIGDGEVRMLRKVVVLCKTPTNLRRNRSYLTGRVGDLPRLRLPTNRSVPAIVERENEPGVFDVYRENEGNLPYLAGQLHMQLLPTHLSSYRYTDGPPQGWFDDGSLPYREPDAAWPEPTGFERWIPPREAG